MKTLNKIWVLLFAVFMFACNSHGPDKVDGAVDDAEDVKVIDEKSVGTHDTAVPADTTMQRNMDRISEGEGNNNSGSNPVNK